MNVFRRTLLPFGLLFFAAACQEDIANLDLIQATPVNAVLMVPVRDDHALRAAWTEELPFSEQMLSLLNRLPLEPGREGLLSLHPVGAGTLHWAYCVRRGFTAFHPSKLASLEPSRRTYASGTIWEWQDEQGKWALAETADWLILSTTDILAEEAIRQLDAHSVGSSYAAYPNLASQLASSAMVTLALEESTPLAHAWMAMPEAKDAPADDLRSWRFAHPR